MRRGRIFIYLALILILGVGVVALLLRRIATPTTEITPTEGVAVPTVPPDTDEVLMAIQNIPSGMTFDDVNITQYVGVYSIPRDKKLPDMLSDPKELIGRMTKYTLDQGSLLQKFMIIDTVEEMPIAGSDWARLIPKGSVAIAIPVSRLSSVAYAPRRGDRVNVIATMLFVDLDAAYQSLLPNESALIVAPGPQGEPGKSPVTISVLISGGGDTSAVGRTEFDTVLEQNLYAVPSEQQRPRVVSQNMIQNVMVLWVGNFPTPEDEKKAAPTPTPQPAAPQGGVAPTGTPPAVPAQGQSTQVQATATPAPPPPPDVITLVVSPQDAVTLNYLINSGALLTIVLRHPEDDSTAELQPMTLQNLMETYSIPVPLKLPYGMQPRIDVLAPPVLANDVVTTPVP